MPLTEGRVCKHLQAGPDAADFSRASMSQDVQNFHDEESFRLMILLNENVSTLLNPIGGRMIIGVGYGLSA